LFKRSLSCHRSHGSPHRSSQARQSAHDPHGRTLQRALQTPRRTRRRSATVMLESPPNRNQVTSTGLPVHRPLPEVHVTHKSSRFKSHVSPLNDIGVRRGNQDGRSYCLIRECSPADWSLPHSNPPHPFLLPSLSERWPSNPPSDRLRGRRAAEFPPESSPAGTIVILQARGSPRVGRGSHQTPLCAPFLCARSLADVGGCAEAQWGSCPDIRPAAASARFFRKRRGLKSLR